MRTKTVSLIVLGAAVCVAIALRVFGPEDSGNTEVAAPLDAPPAQSQSEPPAASAPAVAQDPPVAANRAEPNSNRDAESPASPPQQMVDSVQAFAAEPRDREWATAAEASILSKIAETSGLTMIDLQAECRTTICRVVMVEPRRSTPNPQPSVFVDLIDTIGLTPPWIISVVNPQGGLTSVAYLSREPAAEPGSP